VSVEDYYQRKAENAVYEATIVLGCIVAAGILLLINAVMNGVH
jgi:hypothetical protein